MNVAEFIVEVLRSRGVGRAFGVGGANIEFFASIWAEKVPGQLVLMRREDAAGNAVDWLARRRGELNCVFTTSGGGLLNLVPALGEASSSRNRWVSVCGMPPRSTWNHGGFQDMSSGASVRAETVLAGTGAHVLALNDLAEVLALPSALDAWLGGTLGCPLVLMLPRDLQLESVDVREVPAWTEPASTVVAVDEWADRLRAAKRPLVLLGAGVLASRRFAEVVQELTKTGMTVCEAMGATGMLRGTGVNVVGSFGAATDMVGDDLAMESDFVVMVGAVPAMPVASASVAQRLAAVFSWGPRAYAGAGTFVSGDPAANFADVLRVAATRAADWVPDRTTRSISPHRSPGQHESLSHDAFGITLSQAIPSGTHVVVDAGNCGAAALYHLSQRGDVDTSCALGMGGMGYSVGAAVGAAVGLGGQSVVCVLGDGSWAMAGGDAAVAFERGLPVVFLVAENGGHAMCASRAQIIDGASNQPWRFGPSGAGFFPQNVTVIHSAAQLHVDLHEAILSGHPRVLRVAIEHDDPPPMLPFRSTDELRVGVSQPVLRGWG